MHLSLPRSGLNDMDDIAPISPSAPIAVTAKIGSEASVA